MKGLFMCVLLLSYSNYLFVLCNKIKFDFHYYHSVRKAPTLTRMHA